jgi:hypothetical protein
MLNNYATILTNKRTLLKRILAISFLCLTLNALTPEQEMTEMQADFYAMKTAHEQDFKSYKDNLNAAFKSIKKEL